MNFFYFYINLIQRKIFSEATLNKPSVLFIDEIDVIAGKRDRSNKDMEKRIVT
jgi:SpoVK/Ycf46/Vps4 family AAA+-type ATPase